MRKFIGYLYLLIKPMLLFGLITSAHSFQMAINWEYYEQYGKTGGFSANAYISTGLGYLLITLIIWFTLYFQKKKYFGRAGIFFDSIISTDLFEKGVNKYLTMIINILIVIIILAFFILIIPYWVIDVPNGDFN